jgi:SnoaL-like domain
VSERITSQIDVARAGYRTIAEHGVEAWFDGFAAPDLVFDLRPMGLDVLHGRDEFLSFLQEWMAPYRDWQLSAEELVALDDDVVLGRVRQWGHPHDSDRPVAFVWGQIGIWRDGRCVHAFNYTTYEEARAAAEALVAERRGG